MINTDPIKIEEILLRGVDTIYPNKEAFKTALLSGKRLRIYNGVDPTGPDLHIGHAFPLWKLREFQDLGHEVILLVGSFTAMIGDPTDKMAARVPLTKEQVVANFKTYKKAASKILKFSGENKAQIRYNDKWLAKLDFAKILPLMSHFTLQQMSERDMFEKRINDQKPIGLHEFMYPLMQGYDSVAMDVDVEVGGSDQTFNMLVGRTLQRVMNNKEKFVLTTPLLSDSSGKKMSKSEGNIIAILDAPEEMFGKVMALGDGMIIPLFQNATRISLEDIEKYKQELASGTNPRDIKMKLAMELVRMYHSMAAAKRAKKNFENIFQKHELPEEISEVMIAVPEMNIVDLLVETKLASSKTDARRLMEQGGIKIGEETISDPNRAIKITAEGTVIQRGKRQFAKVKFQTV
ncbi:MAG: tyrosine--tRNA ligase [bacterium]